jgi:hypothetical protein
MTSVDLAAGTVQPVQQHPLGAVLRDHQGVRVVGGQIVEVDGYQHPVPVADGEAGDDQPPVHQLVADLQFTQHFKGAGVDHAGPRGVGSCRLLVGQDRGHAGFRQRGGQGQADRAGADDQYLGGGRKLSPFVHLILRSVPQTASGQT